MQTQFSSTQKSMATVKSLGASQFKETQQSTLHNFGRKTALADKEKSTAQFYEQKDSPEEPIVLKDSHPKYGKLFNPEEDIRFSSLVK